MFLDLSPQLLDRIELRRILRQPDHVDPRVRLQKPLGRPLGVKLRVVPDQQDRAGDLFQQCSEKPHHGLAVDLLFGRLDLEPDLATRRADQHRADHIQALIVIDRRPDAGRLAPSRPGRLDRDHLG